MFIHKVCQLQPKVIYENLKITVKPNRLDLSHLLTIYSYLAGHYQKTAELFRGMDTLTQLRNDVFHKNIDISEQWEAVLDRMLTDIARVRPIVSHVEKTTGCLYDGA